MSWKEHIGKMIRRMRESKGLSQAALAEKVGVRPHHIHEIEVGEKGVSIQRLSDIATALGCYLDIRLTPKNSMDRSN